MEPLSETEWSQLHEAEGTPAHHDLPIWERDIAWEFRKLRKEVFEIPSIDGMELTEIIALIGVRVMPLVITTCPNYEVIDEFIKLREEIEEEFWKKEREKKLKK